jgi:hypothetical protein
VPVGLLQGEAEVDDDEEAGQDGIRELFSRGWNEVLRRDATRLEVRYYKLSWCELSNSHSSNGHEGNVGKRVYECCLCVCVRCYEVGGPQLYRTCAMTVVVRSSGSDLTMCIAQLQAGIPSWLGGWFRAGSADVAYCATHPFREPGTGFLDYPSWEWCGVG